MRRWSPSGAMSVVVRRARACGHRRRLDWANCCCWHGVGRRRAQVEGSERCRRAGPHRAATARALGVVVQQLPACPGRSARFTALIRPYGRK